MLYYFQLTQRPHMPGEHHQLMCSDIHPSVILFSYPVSLTVSTWVFLSPYFPWHMLLLWSLYHSCYLLSNNSPQSFGWSMPDCGLRVSNKSTAFHSYSHVSPTQDSIHSISNHFVCVCVRVLLYLYAAACAHAHSCMWQPEVYF